MTGIQLYNTRTRMRERLEPIVPGKVGMYVCGPTVYDRAHLGNARPVVVFDVLYRLLRHTYGAENVRYVRNFTDVDDKINARAAETGHSIREITDGTIAEYHADMDALGALRPDAEPRATDHIGGMVAMIESLIAKGNAYEAEGHVLFDVRSYPDYGKLSRRSLDDMIAGARVEVAPFKRDPMDFVLWKPSDETTPGWNSPWGRGRPGWHIECSAMSETLLGTSFDIHGGGIDLQFPHHENEIAQSACAHPEADFAKVWMHNEMLLVEGRKMSKSLGNFVTVRELLDRGVPGEVIRFVLLGTHYSKPMDFTEERVAEAKSTLSRWTDAIRDVQPSELVIEELVEILGNDLDLAGAISFLHSLYKEDKYSELATGVGFLGINLVVLNEVSNQELEDRLENPLSVVKGGLLLTTPWSIKERAEQARLKLHEIYSRAKSENDFSSIDRVKSSLLNSGIKIGFVAGSVIIDSIDVDKARLFVFKSLPKWRDRERVFDNAIMKTSLNSFSLSKQALTLHYFAEKVDEVLAEIVV